MFLYVLLALLVGAAACLGLLDDAWSNKEARPGESRAYGIISCVFVVFLLLALWWLTAFRAETIGNDTKNYIELFLSFREGIQPSRRYELGFQAYCFVVGVFTSDPHMFLLVTASLMYGSLGFYIFRYSSNPPLSLCLLFCFAFSDLTNAIRQGFALIILLYAYQQLKSCHRFRFVLLVLCAASFHTTALIFVLLLFSRFTPKKYPTVCLLALVAAAAAFSGILPQIARLFLGDYYAHYFSSAYASSGWLATTFYFLRAGALCLLSFACTRHSDAPPHVRDLTNCTYSILFIVSALGFSMNLFSRIAQFFLLVSISELPNMLYWGKVKNPRVICAALGFVFIAFFLLTLWLRPGWNHLYPYQMWS